MTADLFVTTVNELGNGDSTIVAAGFMKSDEKLSDDRVLADNRFFN